MGARGVGPSEILLLRPLLGGSWGSKYVRSYVPDLGVIAVVRLFIHLVTKSHDDPSIPCGFIVWMYIVSIWLCTAFLAVLEAVGRGLSNGRLPDSARSVEPRLRLFAAGGPFSGLRFAISAYTVVAKAGYGDFRSKKDGSAAHREGAGYFACIILNVTVCSVLEVLMCTFKERLWLESEALPCSALAVKT